MENKVELEDILFEVGFRGEVNILQYRLRPLELKAFRYFDITGGGEVYHFTGSYKTNREMGLVDFKIPVLMDSYEQGVAWLSYGLRQVPFVPKPDWLVKGLSDQDLLPWRKDIVAYNKEIDAYNKVPKALVEEDWFRVILKKLKAIAESSNEDCISEFSFSDNILKIVTNNEALVAPAQGQTWNQEALIQTKSLKNLQNRIYKQDAWVYVWKEKLFVDKRSFPLFNNKE